MKQKLGLLGTSLTLIVILDIVTKRWALATLPGNPLELGGGLLPLTLAYNRGAAFGLTLGDDPRLFFIPVTVLALVLLATLLVQSDRGDYLRLLSVSLIISGAVGNLIDRIRWDRGVVDFIGPYNLGFMMWPIFNVADMAISVGAVVLAISFWRDERDTGRVDGSTAEGPSESDGMPA